MNEYTKSLNRIEFVVTLACSGKCKHCSQGEHIYQRGHIDGSVAADAVLKLASIRKIDSLMTFGGEPLLFFEDVCKIQCAAKESNIPNRELITNGFFSKDENKIQSVVDKLYESGVNKILLSVDAFHQETIPIKPVKIFAECVKKQSIEIKVHPAWLVDSDDDNPYNLRTKKLLEEFSSAGFDVSSGNVIFPNGNAVKYLSEYFKDNQIHKNPYVQNPEDIRAICISPDGEVLNGNIYDNSIIDIVENYLPH